MSSPQGRRCQLLGEANASWLLLCVAADGARADGSRQAPVWGQKRGMKSPAAAAAMSSRSWNSTRTQWLPTSSSLVGAKLLATSDVFMQLLPHKGILAIAAVIDIAMHARGGPLAAKALASRHRLPPRHLEQVLQALVRHGILKGIRGPRGGYELARERSRITADEILRAAGTVDDLDATPTRRFRRPSKCSLRRCRASISRNSRARPKA